MLCTHKRSSNLSCEAKVRIDNIMAALQCAEQKANKLLAELDSIKGIGLIERKRQGLGKPNIIYVKNFVVRPANPKHFHDNSDATEHQENILNKGIEPPKSTRNTNHKSRNAKTTSLDLRKSQDISNNEYSDIDTNDTDLINLSISSATTMPNPTRLTAPSLHHRFFCQSPEQTAIEHIESYCNLIRCNIDYDVLCERYSRERLDELVEIMVETVCSQKRTTSISGDDMPTEVVRSRLLKLDMFHMEYVLDQLAKTTTKIYNICSYLLTALYRALTTISNFYSAAVNHDFYGART